MREGFQTATLPTIAAADGGKVERRDGADESVKRTVVLAIPDAGNGCRLILEDFLRRPDAETQEVRELGDIDLRLEHGLGLTEHSRSVQDFAIRTRDHVRRLQEDRGTMFPRHFFPCLFGSQRGVNRHGQFLLARHRALGDHMTVIMRHGDLERLLREDLFPADDQRDLHNLCRLTGKFCLQFRTFFRPRQIAAESVVVRSCDGEISV